MKKRKMGDHKYQQINCNKKNSIFFLSVIFLILILTSQPSSAIVYFQSGAENGCPGEWGTDSACLSLGGRIEATQELVHSGSYSFKHPVNPTIDVHDGKLLTFDKNVLDAIDININGGEGEAFFSGWYYIAQGYEDEGWRVNGQWKIARPTKGAQNPKISWGFRNYNGTFQVIFNIQTVGTYYQSEPKPVPRNRWFHMETYLKTSETNGQVIIWQDGEEIFNVAGVNTITQILTNGSWSTNTALYWAPGNYISGYSEPIDHIIYTDDWMVTDYQVGPGTTIQECSGLGGKDCCIVSETCPGTDLGISSDCPGTCCSEACILPKPMNLCDNLVLLMHFDNLPEYGETLTHIYDFSGNGNNGSCSGSSCPTWNATGGNFAGAFEYDGDDDKVTIADPANGSLDFGSDGSFTITAWVKGPNQNEKGIVWKQVSSAGVGYRCEFKGTSPHFTCLVSDGTTYQYSNGVTDVSGNEWFHLAYVVNRATNFHKLYTNANLEDSDDISDVGDTSNSVSFLIGDRSGPGNFKGTIDDLAVWSRVLSTSEIWYIYNSGAPITCATSTCSPADTNSDNIVSMVELMSYISDWKAGSVTMVNLMTAIGEWKNGC